MKTYDADLIANPTPLDKIHQLFIREKKYLENVSEKYLIQLYQSWNAFRRKVPGDSVPTVAEFTQSALLEFVAAYKEEEKVKDITINTYISGIKPFISWLYENEYLAKPLRLNTLKTEKRLLEVLTEEEVESIRGFKSSCLSESRIHAIACTILDAGCRITEICTLSPENIDFDNLVLKVYGKGRKERLIPFSFELRKILLRHQKAYVPKGARYFFCNHFGGKLHYGNIRKHYVAMVKSLGVEPKGAFHTLRHTFGTLYIKNGGNQFYLQQILGHADISTTKIYVTPDLDSMRDVHGRFSPLGKRH